MFSAGLLAKRFIHLVRRLTDQLPWLVDTNDLQILLDRLANIGQVGKNIYLVSCYFFRIHTV